MPRLPPVTRATRPSGIPRRMSTPMEGPRERSRRERCLDRSPKPRRINGRIPVEVPLDAAEVLLGAGRVYQRAGHHLADVCQVQRVASLHLGERLGVRVKMVKGKAPDALDEWTPVLPARRHRNEVGRTRQLDIELQLLLEPGDGPEQRVLLRNQLDV